MLVRPRYFAASIVATLAALALGCPRSNPSGRPSSTTPQSGGKQAVGSETLLESAIELLQASRRTPDAHPLAAQRLNHYLEESRAAGKFEVESINTDVMRNLAARLSERQRQIVTAQEFIAPDAVHLETCFMCRDVALHVTARLKDDRAKAEALFDWVVRNVQLVGGNEAKRSPMNPQIVLLLGRGTEEERACTFMNLLRQVGIESAMVGYVDTDPQTKKTIYVGWLPAALVDDSLLLFDTSLGLPVPGVDEGSIATLRQVIENPELLKSLELDATQPYRMTPERLKSAALMYESSPAFFAPRMKFLEERLPGKNRVVLWMDLLNAAERCSAAAGSEVVQELWSFGVTIDLLSRESNEYVQQIRNQLMPLLTFSTVNDARVAHLRGGYEDAMPIYLSNRTRPPMQLKAEFQKTHDWVREDSTYFLGAAKFEQREFGPAVNWFADSYLKRYPDGKWVPSARFHLALCAEARGDAAKAIEFYTVGDPTSQSIGNRIRARRLGWQPDPEKPSDSDAPPAVPAARP